MAQHCNLNHSILYRVCTTSKMATLTPNSFKSQKLPVDGFNWKAKKPRFTKKFIQNYDDDSSKGYILEVDDSYSKRLQEIHSDFLFLPECMKIEKCQKHVCSMYDVKNLYTKKHEVGLGLQSDTINST